MKKSIVIPVTTLKSRETTYIDLAETTVATLDALIREMESEKLGGTICANEELIESRKGEVEYFTITKTIDTDAIKEPLKNIERLVKQIREENEKLKSAIVDELIKEALQE